jgi:hypothetical protein
MNKSVYIGLLVLVVGGLGYYIYDSKQAQNERDAVAMRNFDSVRNYNPKDAPIVPFPKFEPSPELPKKFKESIVYL